MIIINFYLTSKFPFMTAFCFALSPFPRDKLSEDKGHVLLSVKAFTALNRKNFQSTVLNRSFSPVTCLTHDGVYIHPTLSSHCIHMPVYICISIPPLQTDSSMPFF